MIALRAQGPTRPFHEFALDQLWCPWNRLGIRRQPRSDRIYFEPEQWPERWVLNMEGTPISLPNLPRASEVIPPREGVFGHGTILSYNAFDLQIGYYFARTGGELTSLQIGPGLWEFYVVVWAGDTGAYYIDGSPLKELSWQQVEVPGHVESSTEPKEWLLRFDNIFRKTRRRRIAMMASG